MVFKKYKLFLLSVVPLILIVAGILFAGEIDTTSAPESTGYTLENIYNKLTDPGYTTSPSHDLNPGSNTPSAPSMYSLEDIFTVVPAYQTLVDSTTTLEVGIYATTTLSDIEVNLAPENIASGTTMFGVTGTFECTP